MIDQQAKRQLIQLLAHHLDEFRNDAIAKSELSECPLIECTDGIFRIPSQVYLSSQAVQEILGNQYPIAFVPEDNQKSVKTLFQWLGVENKPRPSHLLKEIKRLVAQPSNNQNRQKIQNIFIHLNQRWSKEHLTLRSDLKELRTLRWLPAQREYSKWYSPDYIYTDENSVLFFTQALFIDLPQTKLDLDFIEFLGIQREPTIPQVVSHLITCSEINIGINYDVYQFLQENVNDIDSTNLSNLQQAKCIYLDKKYIHPSKVFWNYSHFEPYRLCLKLKYRLRPFAELFTQLNVHNDPDSEDAISVLEEVSDKYAQAPQSLSQEDRSIMSNCYEILARGLDNNEINRETIAERLQNKRVVITEQNILKMPHEVFFKDRPNLVDKFPILQDSLLTKLKVFNQYHVLKAAGVRPLSQVVRTELINKDTLQTTDDQNLSCRIKDRKYLIKRVVVETTLVDNFVRQLLVKEAQNLKLCYHLEIDSHSEQKTEDVLTYLDKSEGQFTLYYSRQNSEIPWAHIAREIAYALELDAETGQVASALKEVISADSRERASEILDALGFAPGTEPPPKTRESSQPSQLTEDKQQLIGSYNIANSSNIAKSDPGTTDPERAYEIGRWAKIEAQKLYQNTLNYTVNNHKQIGFDFLCNGQELAGIQVLVNAITSDRPNIRLSLLEWTTMAKNHDRYELLIISHNHQNINEILRITKAWNTLVYALSQLQVQGKTTAIYNTKDLEALIGFQQNSHGNGNDVLLNWHRLIKILPQQNITKYRQTQLGFEQIA